MSYENYHVVLAVAAFISDKKGRLLIVKKSRHERIDAGLWVVPGGKIKQDEQIIDGLRREVKEEVGLMVVSCRWMGEDVFRVEDKYFHAPHFMCEVESTKKITLEKNLLEYRWVTKGELAIYTMPEGLRKDAVNFFKKYE